MRVFVLVGRIAVVLMLLVFAFPFVWEKVTGDYFMTVTGGSMRPTYQVGDVLVVQPPTGKDLSRVGQPVVVAFTPGDRSTQYVHRVHELVRGGALLKGDGNEIVDPAPVTEEQVLGTPRLAIAGIGAAIFHITQSWVARGVVAVLLLAVLFLPAASRRTRVARRDPDAGSESDSGPRHVARKELV